MAIYKGSNSWLVLIYVRGLSQRALTYPLTLVKTNQQVVRNANALLSINCSSNLKCCFSRTTKPCRLRRRSAAVPGKLFARFVVPKVFVVYIEASRTCCPVEMSNTHRVQNSCVSPSSRLNLAAVVVGPAYLVTFEASRQLFTDCMPSTSW